MIQRFKSYKSKGFGIFIIIASLILLFLTCILPYILYGRFSLINYFLIVFITIPTILLFFWIWISTHYSIEDDIIRIVHGPFRLVIPIADILEIHLNQKSPGILKACLSFECVMVKYGKYRSVYISPVDSNIFIKTLKAINSDIVVKPPEKRDF